MTDPSILVINTGSSSLKYGLYVEQNSEEQLLFGGSADGIGRSDSKIDLRDGDDRVLRSKKLNFASQADALDHATRWLAELASDKPCAIEKVAAEGFKWSTTLSWICETSPDFVTNNPGCWCCEQSGVSGLWWFDWFE